VEGESKGEREEGGRKRGGVSRWRRRENIRVVESRGERGDAGGARR